MKSNGMQWRDVDHSKIFTLRSFFSFLSDTITFSGWRVKWLLMAARQLLFTLQSITCRNDGIFRHGTTIQFTRIDIIRRRLSKIRNKNFVERATGHNVKILSAPLRRWSDSINTFKERRDHHRGPSVIFTRPGPIKNSRYSLVNNRS